MIRSLDPDPLTVTGDDPSPRQAWQEVIGLALAMIVAAFVLGYVVGKIG